MIVPDEFDLWLRAVGQAWLDRVCPAGDFTAAQEAAADDWLDRLYGDRAARQACADGVSAEDFAATLPSA